MNKHSLHARVFLGFVFVTLYIPIVSLMLFSFNESKSLTRFTGFSLEWYVKLFQSDQIMDAVVTTVVIALAATLISTILGTMAALALAGVKRRVRETTLGLNQLPIVNPEIVTAISFFVFFGAIQMERGWFTMLIAHIAFCTPYVVITVYLKVRSMDAHLVDAAYDLGATPLQALYKVILPQIKVGILAGAAIAFTMSFDDFVISYFAASGSAVQNISIYLYTLKRGVEPTINALSTMIIAIIGIKIIKDYWKQQSE
jgi:spermidine/putrescine transport system permease protein